MESATSISQEMDKWGWVQMRKAFDVDGIHYVVRYIKNSFVFYADSQKSTAVISNLSGMDFAFGDTTSKRLWSNFTLGRAKPFMVKKKILEFVDHALKCYNPQIRSFREISES